MAFRERVASVLEGIQTQVSIIADIVSEVGGLAKEILWEIRALRRDLRLKEKSEDETPRTR
jgi:hypothetical protein